VQRFWGRSLARSAEIVCAVHGALERHPESALIQSNGLAFLCALISSRRPAYGGADFVGGGRCWRCARWTRTRETKASLRADCTC
jgi:hypothetical protein